MVLMGSTLHGQKYEKLLVSTCIKLLLDLLRVPRLTQNYSEDSECMGEMNYLCSYTRLCIDARLRCNGDENCGENDDSDEAHCMIVSFFAKVFI
jgi:hypothetical protein